MMKRHLFLILTLLLTLLTVTVFPSIAQSSPDITNFNTTATEVGRTALVNRTARIPVSWTTANRPLTANLVFEQIMPNGNLINVELPRLIPFVASAGDGIAAPILPDGDVMSISLRVSLINLFTNFVYDSEVIVIPIVQGESGGNGGGHVQAITAFDVRYAAPINRNELANGTVRLPVSWTAINRPTSSNLIFEQILPDGTIVNAELPRDFQWVNSSDSGIVAPVAVSEDVDEIVLRLRLADISFDRTYDQRTVTIPIQSAETIPEITSFTTTTDLVSVSDVEAGYSLLDVAWAVSNRPSGTNLVFEQILPDGRVRNAELPREILIVSSVGNGFLSSILPSQDVAQLVFQVRLVDLSNNNTLASRQLTVALSNTNTIELIVVTGDACYSAPFPPDNGLRVGGEGRVQYFNNGGVVSAFDDLELTNLVSTLNTDDTFTIEDGPYCSYFNQDNGYNIRQWYINFNGQFGWVSEYVLDYNRATASYENYIYTVVPAEQDDTPLVAIDSFTVSPSDVTSTELDSTTFTISWETSNAESVSLSYLGSYYFDQALDGSFTVSGSSIENIGAEIVFRLSVHGALGNSEFANFVVPIASSVDITNFTVSPETAAGNEPVTFLWDIEGDFQSAALYLYDNCDMATSDNIHDIDSNSGTFTYNLSDDRIGILTIGLVIFDNSGVIVSESVSVDVGCAYDWGFSITEADCPETALISRTGAYQAFQRGFMIWLPSDSESLWVFYNDGTFARYQDSWNGGDYTIAGTPPDGTFAPERGFGYLWHTVPEVRSGLSWATGGEEGYTVNFQENFQNFGGYNGRRSYIQGPNGQIIRAFGRGGTPNTWEIAD